MTLEFILDSDALNLSGSFFVGGLDYMDPNLNIPTSIWTATLKQGFVGCLKGDLSYSHIFYSNTRWILNIFDLDKIHHLQMICNLNFAIDLIINGADIDVVAYSHDQNSGNILLYSP